LQKTVSFIVTAVNQGSSHIEKVMGLTIQGLNPARARNVPVLYNYQTSSGAHPASYSVGTRILSSGWGFGGVGVNRASTRSWPPPPAEDLSGAAWYGQRQLYLKLCW